MQTGAFYRVDRHCTRVGGARAFGDPFWLAMNLSRSTRRHMPFLLEFFSLFYPSMRLARKSDASCARSFSTKAVSTRRKLSTT